MPIRRDNGTGRSIHPIAGSGQLFIVVRLPALSEWDRQVIHGVRRFAHGRRQWRVYVETGDFASSLILNGSIPVDGIVTSMASHPVPPWRRFLRKTRAKIVSVSFLSSKSLQNIPQVRIDEAKVAAMIGRHLLSGGFRRLAYFAHARQGFMDTRLEAFLAFAAQQGTICHTIPESWRYPGDPPLAKIAGWIERLPKPVGIVAWNMKLARAILSACKRARVDVPEQAAVVAWDDDPLLAETLEPTISAAVLPAERLGYEAARLLDQLLNGAPCPVKPVIVEPTGLLHVRQSSDVATLEHRDVYLAMQYIREHADKPMTVGEIAGVLKISRSKLERQFVRVTGKTPHDAISQARLDHAKELLIETHWPLTRIAKQCGAGSQETLRRLFLKHEAMTPGAYRQRFAGT